jgi:hypothetical protein
LVVILTATLLTSCGNPERTGTPNLSWQPVDSLNSVLPSGVKVFEGTDLEWPLKAWYARIDGQQDDIRFGVLHSDEEDGRESTSSFAHDEGACVVLNGGYFRMDLTPSRPIGLLLVDSNMVHQPTPSVLRKDVSYPVARAAIGVNGNEETDIAWVASTDSGLVSLDPPPENRLTEPVDSLNLAVGTAWPMRDALSAGPSLISQGRIRITVDEEVFFGSSIPDVHPRSAIGITPDQETILLVVDGRQGESSGVDLEALARILFDLGAVEAMNLDGGGSSTLVVEGVRLNRPQGRDSEREIASAVAVFCE